LTGDQASLQPLDQALARRPSIVHFATHFLQSAGGKPEALIALSIGPDRSPELLGPAEISRRRLDLGLVVLSGCTSGEAEALPSEGLMGMTRAWLAAGAHSVVASLWPTPDDQGKLFVSFYRHLAELKKEASSPAAAEALRQAQLDMLASHSWHSSPGYWAAYTVAGKE
jgi:CHAT domain-containing protein